MKNVIVVLFAGLTFFLELCQVQAADVVLLQEGQDIVRSELPGSWTRMTNEELEKIASDGTLVSSLQYGKLVTGFVAPPEGDGQSMKAQILVFSKVDDSINKEKIEKVYDWLQQNNDLVASVLPAQVTNMKIENIEYLRRQPAILFKTQLAMEQGNVTGLSSIVFLKTSYLDIICLAGEQTYPNYSEMFTDFVKSVNIPVSLQFNNQPTNWFIQKWQQIRFIRRICG